MIGKGPSMATHYESLTGIGVDHDAAEMYRLAWELSEIAIYIGDFRRPHDEPPTRPSRGRTCSTSLTQPAGNQPSVGRRTCG